MICDFSFGDGGWKCHLETGHVGPHSPHPDPGSADEKVDHPAHYGGADDPYEAIKVIEAWDLGFNLGNCVKYLSRAGKKDPAKLVEDLRKAAWYLNREIEKNSR